MKKKYYYSVPVMILFTILAVTGIFMFFHMETGGMKLMHEYLGLVFVAVAAIHLFMNWKPFVSYLKFPAVQVIGAILLVVATGVYIAGSSGKENPIKAVAMKVPAAPISVTAALLQVPENDVVHLLNEKTGKQWSASDSLDAIAKESGKHPMELLELIVEQGKKD